MKIGIDSYSYHRYFGEIYQGQKDPATVWGLCDFLERVRIRHAGVEAVSLETCFITDKEKKDIINILADYNYEFIFAWGHSDGFMVADIDKALEELKEYIKLAASLGQRIIRIVASGIGFYYDPHKPQVDLAIQSINRIKNAAKEYDVKLALENHGDFHIDEIFTILDSVNSDCLGITFDTGNSLRLHEDCLDAVRKYGDKILLVHAKDVALEKGNPIRSLVNLNCVPAGEGIVDFKGIFSELLKNQFDGNILIEISRLHSSYDHIDEMEILNKGLEYLSNLRGEINE